MDLNLHLFILSVPPSRLTLEGPSSASVDEELTYRCHASSANPAPKLTFSVNGQSMGEGFNSQSHPPTEATPYGGWSVTTDLRVEIGVNMSKVAIMCVALSHGHYGQVMTKKVEKIITVLSKSTEVCFCVFLGKWLQSK